MPPDQQPAVVDRARGPRPWRRWPSVANLVGLAFALAGFCLGLRRISDNSLFTHIATGRLILDRGSVPVDDPYSFTAAGEPWVVQSWLADLAYGAADRLGGGNGVRLLGGVLAGTLLALAWRLTGPARSLVARVLIGALVAMACYVFLSPRPLVFGLVLLGATLVIVTEGRDARWLIPIMWLWVNVHGSFPLGLVALGCFALGSYLDGDRSRELLRPLLWASVGVALGAINPIGPNLLLFPKDLLGRMEILQNVVEWRSPDFSTGYARLFLVLVVVAILALVRRPSYRAAVPLVVFVAAALVGMRNIPIASIVMVPGLAIGLADIGRLDGRDRGPATGVLAAVMVLVAGLVAGRSLASPAYDFTGYPVRTIAWMDEQGLLGPDRRVATTDTVGNLLELTRGADAAVFFDDRYDMYPAELSRDYVALTKGTDRWPSVLDGHEVEYLLWPSSSPLASMVARSPDWRVLHEDPDDAVVVACRRGVAPDC